MVGTNPTAPPAGASAARKEAMVSWRVGAIAPACPTALRESAAVLSARIIGNGRAGASFAGALTSLKICEVLAVLGRDDDPSGAAQDVDLVLIAVPDGAVAD